MAIPRKNHTARMLTLLRMVEDGMSVSQAITACGASSSLWYQWLERSYRGETNGTWAHRYVQAVGEICDRCGQRELRNKMTRRIEQSDDGAEYTLRWCGERCERLWDLEEANE